jgi:hypothetical protein
MRAKGVLGKTPRDVTPPQTSHPARSHPETAKPYSGSMTGRDWTLNAFAPLRIQGDGNPLHALAITSVAASTPPQTPPTISPP